MAYLISKPETDGRVTTCGFTIPDGCTVVVEMDFSNVRQIENVKKFGYNVEPTDLPVGCYFTDGRRVDRWSLQEWAQNRALGYPEKHLKFLDDEPSGKVAEAKEEPQGPSEVDQELMLLRTSLDEKGIKYRTDAGVMALKKKLEAAG